MVFVNPGLWTGLWTGPWTVLWTGFWTELWLTECTANDGCLCACGLNCFCGRNTSLISCLNTWWDVFPGVCSLTSLLSTCRSFPLSTGKSNLFWWLLSAGGIMCMRQRMYLVQMEAELLISLAKNGWLQQNCHSSEALFPGSPAFCQTSFCHDTLQVDCFYNATISSHQK